MLVGATTRDLLLYHVYGHFITRATYDLDFANHLNSWEQFANVKQLLLGVPGFTDKGRIGNVFITSHPTCLLKPSSTSSRSES